MATNMMPKVGDKAPSFHLPALPTGSKVNLSDYKGRFVVLYFYPRDMTPGCTTEACDFRDSHSRLAAHDAVVLGVSTDSIESHQKFAEKYELPFPLLADTDHSLCEKYGVWVEKNMYGKKSLGVQRASFLIDPLGKIAAVWPRVKVAGHVDEVVKKLNELAGE